MKRRALLAGVAAAGLPTLAYAQKQPRIGYLSGRSLATDGHLLTAFREGLKGAGYVEGQNVVLDVRWADGSYEALPKMAAELAATNPDVIVAVGGNSVGLAAKAATSTIPVVFGAGADPVRMGLVTSLARPEGNVTGMTLQSVQLDTKRLELLHEMLPQGRRFAMLVNPTNPGSLEQLVLTRESATSRGIEFDILQASTAAELDNVFGKVSRDSVDGLSVASDAFLIIARKKIVGLVAERRLPAIYAAREFADDGGLASFGTRWFDMYRVLGGYAGRILKGARPADLPVQRPSTFEFVINLRTARELGINLPPLLVSRADEVIE